MRMNSRMHEVPTISPSQITKVLLSDLNSKWDPKDAARGRSEHKRILNSVGEQLTPDLGLFDSRETAMVLPAGVVIARERRIQALIAEESLCLRVTPDAIIQSPDSILTVEIKSSAKYPTHILQLALGCMATEANFWGRAEIYEGMLYAYGGKQDQVKYLPGGGRDLWPMAESVAVYASNILRYGKAKGCEDMVIDSRRELDAIWTDLSPALIGSLE